MAMIGERKRIPVAEVIRAARKTADSDVVVVTLDKSGEVRTYGSSGGEVSSWLLDQAKKQIIAA